MIPREFYIEDRLERYRLEAPCNLGESGFKNFTFGEICQKLRLNMEELANISLADSPNRGSLSLRKAIAELYPNITHENVLVTTGTSEGLFLFFNLALNKGDIVRYLAPAFQAIYEIPKSLGALLEPIQIESNFIPLQALFQKNANLIVINQPHNPTGAIIAEDDELLLKEKIFNWKGTILFDEHYRFLDYNKTLGFTGAGLSKNTFATGSITKSFGVTGLRIGWLIGEPSFLDKARSFKDYLTHTVNPISEFFALKLIQQRDDFLDPIKEMISANRKVLNETIPKIQSIAKFNPPLGGLVSFPKLKEGIKSRDYVDNLYKNTGVFVLPGADFEAEGYIRVGLGENPERFAHGLKQWLLWDG